MFCIDVTFEMRTSEYGEICISIDKLKIIVRVFISNGKKGEESKTLERQRERERERVSVRVLVETHNGVDQHPQQRRAEKHICGNK
jgi:hypothetical protein